MRAPEVAAAANGKRVVTNSANPNLATIARGLPDKALLRVEDLFLAELGSVDLELERFRVFAEDAEIHSGGVDTRGTGQRLLPRHSRRASGLAGGPELSSTGWHRGHRPDAGGDYWKIEGRRGVAGLDSRRVDPAVDSPKEPFDCLTDGLPTLQACSNRLFQLGRRPATARLSSPQGAAGLCRPRVAVETDWEFLDLFNGDEAAATDYVGDLFAFSSSIYESEIDTGPPLVSFLRLWPGTADG